MNMIAKIFLNKILGLEKHEREINSEGINGGEKSQYNGNKINKRYEFAKDISQKDPKEAISVLGENVRGSIMNSAERKSFIDIAKMNIKDPSYKQIRKGYLASSEGNNFDKTKNNFVNVVSWKLTQTLGDILKDANVKATYDAIGNKEDKFLFLVGLYQILSNDYEKGVKKSYNKVDENDKRIEGSKIDFNLVDFIAGPVLLNSLAKTNQDLDNLNVEVKKVIEPEKKNTATPVPTQKTTTTSKLSTDKNTPMPANKETSEKPSTKTEKTKQSTDKLIKTPEDIKEVENRFEFGNTGLSIAKKPDGASSISFEGNAVTVGLSKNNKMNSITFEGGKVFAPEGKIFTLNGENFRFIPAVDRNKVIVNKIEAASSTQPQEKPKQTDVKTDTTSTKVDTTKPIPTQIEKQDTVVVPPVIPNANNIPSSNDIIDNSKAKKKYEKKMDELYGDETKNGALFNTDYTDKRVNKNTKLKVGDVFVKQGDILAKNSTPEVKKQGEILINSGKNLKKLAEGVKTVSFDEQKKEIEKITNGKNGFLGIGFLGSKGIKERVDKYIKNTSSEIGDDLDKKTLETKKKLIGEQKQYEGYDKEIENLEKQSSENDNSFNTLLEGKSFEDLKVDELKKAGDLINQKINIQSDLKLVKEKKITGIQSIGNKVSNYYEEHENFIDLVESPLLTQIQKLNDGKIKIISKVGNLQKEFTTNRGIINDINNDTYKGSLDKDITQYCGIEVNKELSSENKKSILILSLKEINGIISGEISFYVEQLNGINNDYSSNIENLDNDLNNNEGGINKQIIDLTTKLGDLKRQKNTLIKAKEYSSLQTRIEVDILNYDQAVEQMKSDIPNYQKVEQAYSNFNTQAKSATLNTLDELRDQQRALQRETLSPVRKSNIVQNRKVIEQLGDKNILQDLKIDLSNIQGYDINKVVISENLTSGLIIEQKNKLKNLKGDLQEVNNEVSMTKSLPFSLINPIEQTTLEISKNLFPGNTSAKQIKSSEKIMNMYNELSTTEEENTTK